MLSFLTRYIGFSIRMKIFVLVFPALFSLPLIFLMIIAGATVSEAGSDFDRQCDAAVGPESGASTTPTVGSAFDPGSLSAPETVGPTTNPFAVMTFTPNEEAAASPRQRACLSAMRSAPYQQPALRVANSGPAVECAREVALAQVNSPSGSEQDRNVAAGITAVTKHVLYRASVAALTGSCVRDSAAPLPPESAPGSCSSELSSSVVLPNTIAAQAICGQIVDPKAVSAGDLVFWEYRNNTPTRAAIAVGATSMVTEDPVSGRAVMGTMPTNADVRIKRYLIGAR
ncbi:hypothetical protein D5S18_00905 [Nocardia panacis]|uniref:Uncharacterized protein n=1 Tax=Nocardia panacis TaxID=2340916 RepID=A0A3A4L0E2_9NOCA|nr:hypothetical protein [Nocardia panacis]RJO79865.1 hypothetical protein D5S18_00905 [Nocardia panacis]